jgi:hypothetical protein
VADYVIPEKKVKDSISKLFRVVKTWYNENFLRGYIRQNTEEIWQHIVEIAEVNNSYQIYFCQTQKSNQRRSIVRLAVNKKRYI